MKIFCTSSSDTYITNKILDGSTRVTDANVGRAGVLDLFKLYDETDLPPDERTASSNVDLYARLDDDGDGTPDTSIELSRILVKFDLDKIHELTGSKIDLASSNFSAKLKLFDVRTGHAVPRNFKVMAIPLSQSFDEGSGRNISAYNDLDASNFLTASYSNSADNVWNEKGANASGSLGTNNIDLIETADFGDGSGTRRLVFEQTFDKGTEDLVLDITSFVSATIAGQIPNHGFRVSLTGSEERDEKSRFIKRFASRHVTNQRLRPRVEVSFDDSTVDHHRNFFFDISGSLFLNSYGRSGLKNLVSGNAGVIGDVTGDNCLKLKLERGDFTYTTLGSQHKAGTIRADGTTFQTGVYSASFAIPSQETSLVDRDTSLANLIVRDGKIKFEQYWVSNDESYAYHTGSVTISRLERSAGSFVATEPLVHATNVDQQYTTEDEARVRLFGRDLLKENEPATKIPQTRQAEIFDNIYYRVKDVDSGDVILDFGESDNSTRVSTDVDGMFFDFHLDVLPPGRSYTFEYLIIEPGSRKIVSDSNVIFRVK